MFIRLGSFINEAATKKKQIPLSSVNAWVAWGANEFRVFCIFDNLRKQPLTGLLS